MKTILTLIFVSIVVYTAFTLVNSASKLGDNLKINKVAQIEFVTSN